MASISSLWHCLALLPRSTLFWCRYTVLVKSHPFSTLLDLQLSFYCPLCYNSRVHCSLLQCPCPTSVILAGAHSYFVVSSFKCEWKNSCHDLIPKPPIYLHIVIHNSSNHPTQHKYAEFHSMITSSSTYLWNILIIIPKSTQLNCCENCSRKWLWTLTH
jgi:hypothetical protein